MIDPSGIDQTYTRATLLRERDKDAAMLRARWAATRQTPPVSTEETTDE